MLQQNGSFLFWNGRIAISILCTDTELLVVKWSSPYFCLLEENNQEGKIFSVTKIWQARNYILFLHVFSTLLFTFATINVSKFNSYK